ncbi:hypothetical protein NE237_007764 [Protea cynaroides]|uniref:Uncharacterized protein n=1 Tax=Protea cynaroides TaxID=273540 RepID=A0A9Q0QWE6_9MAGN|nr:hypothetical protein NE237_007764 [Protea cynaroides]
MVGYSNHQGINWKLNIARSRSSKDETINEMQFTIGAANLQTENQTLLTIREKVTAGAWQNIRKVNYTKEESKSDAEILRHESKRQRSSNSIFCYLHPRSSVCCTAKYVNPRFQFLSVQITDSNHNFSLLLPTKEIW